ncbi:hypothetical protein PGUG_03765 [Meyerozyma guilliermondii ATCC 6260]|uniref:Uncharacterized protein n=1 Tax=Meyerozyma guilliermondii (strain ATCC 6260 / CBS 566 / DSM 6381 / JCM 1539 / NBRC 10279 / NRRL Y-324) TaxID=294746 RepID=A5DKG4_PICGU|nr:uncharacterized protein PGUG_03765 [Meyerozyma guilliermondii ATCC 6260]EDK39667.2 hypothetical protein PGUG_03765 [Meyerozyma guilliermondii ATCC 6260]
MHSSFFVNLDLHALAEASRYSGILSVSVWLFAQLPQILENHINQSVSGVSFLFLVSWMMGDATNLVGCILTRALPFQTSLACYYCFIDLILGIQYWYYTRVFPHHRIPHNLLQSPSAIRASNHAWKSPRDRLLASQKKSPFTNSTKSPKRKRRGTHSLASRLLGSAIITIPGAQAAPVALAGSSAICLHFNWANLGKLSAWTCSGFYLSARVPQIVKNYNLKSTKGTSIFLFLLAMTGNLLYTTSIVINLYLISVQYYNDDLETVFWSQLPFVVGSLGTVIFDAIIIMQKVYYSDKAPSTTPENPLHFQKPDWYTSNFEDQISPSTAEHGPPLPNEHTRLLSSPKSYTAIVEPPQHYVSISSKNHSTNSQTNFLTNTIRSFSRNSFSGRSGSFSYPTSPVKPSVPRPIAKDLSTSLIPSIVESYSSVSKKMLDDSKVPFSPIDFLEVTPSGSSVDQTT